MRYATSVACAILSSFLALPAVAESRSPAIRVDNTTRVIPHFAVGAGWRTEVQVYNMDSRPVDVAVLFYATDGTSVSVPVSFQGEGFTNAVGGKMTVQVGAMASIVLEDLFGTLPQTTGWILVTPSVSSSAGGQIGGLAILRYRGSSAPQSEATIPVESCVDHNFLLSFDNTNGFSTGVAIVNPISTGENTIQISLRNQDGKFLDNGKMILGPRNQVSFDLGKTYPATADQRGTMVVTGLSCLAGIGFRFSPDATFTTLHAVSYIGVQ
jgi:hypothetical protein